jgi:hypothetical protein
LQEGNKAKRKLDHRILVNIESPGELYPMKALVKQSSEGNVIVDLLQNPDMLSVVPDLAPLVVLEVFLIASEDLVSEAPDLD